MIFPETPTPAAPAPTLYLKENPVGIDIEIQEMQRYLHDELPKVWGTVQKPFLIYAYGSIFKTQRENDTLGEAFSSRNEYEDILTCDDSKLMFIEATASEKVSAKYYKTKVDVCFIVNLNEAYPNITHRATSEAIGAVAKILERIGLRGKTITGYETGVNEVFGNLKFKYTDNMQPYFVFKFTVEFEYDLQKTIC